MSAFPWTDGTVRNVLGLRSAYAEEGVEYTGVTTDSRTVRQGDLYVALVGERFDGHDFVADALSRGALGAVVSHPVAGNPAGARLYPVGDTLVALGMLAAHRRDGMDAPVVAITGSSGKTSTKDMASAALSATLRVHATEGNLNNRIGMPLTVLSTPVDAEAVVLELGTNEPGEIAALAQIARPDIAVITTVGESHLEKLGSLAGVMEEKLSLLRHMAERGRCVVGDEPEGLANAAKEVCPRLRVVGWSERADEGGRPRHPDVDVFGKYTFEWKGHRVTAPMFGRHGVTNALMALTVAELLGVPAREAVKGLSTTRQRPMRGEYRRIGNLTLIVDCYNANPQSVRASIEVLEAQGMAARKAAVLGSMLELGEASEDLHRTVLADALSRDIDLVVATGLFAGVAEDALAEVAGAARSAGAEADDDVLAPAATRLVAAEDWETAYPRVRERLRGDEVVLLKASRGVALEGILPLLEDDFGAAATSGAEASERPASGGRGPSASASGDAAVSSGDPSADSTAPASGAPAREEQPGEASTSGDVPGAGEEG